MSKSTHTRLKVAGPLSAIVLGLGGLTGAASAAPEGLAARAEQLAIAKGAAAGAITQKQGKLEKNGADALPLKLAPKQCAVAAVMAEDAVLDVNLSLEVKGGPALSDEASGAGAALRYCAGAASEQLTLRVRSERATKFALGVWPVAAAAATDAGVAAVPLEAAPSTPTLPSLNKRLQALIARRAAGLNVMTPVREEDVTAQEPHTREVVLAGDQCYRVLVVAEPIEVEVELQLSQGKATPALSSARGKQELVLPDAKSFCPKTSGAHSVSVRTTAGAARVAWQVLGASNPELDVRFPVGGKGDQLVATRMRDIHRNQGAQAPVMAFESGQLATNDVHTSSFDVVGGRCYLAVAAGVPSLRALELEIVDQRGNTIARGQEQNSINMQRVCADLSGRWTLRAKAFKGYGAFGVQVFVAPQP